MADVETLIGLQLALGFPESEATPQLIEALRRTHAHSLVVFSRNFTSPEQFLRLATTLETRVGRRLLIMVDHEGGRIIRFNSGVTRFPDPLALGARSAAEDIEAQGATEAQELRRLRVAVNLAPCVDVLAPGCDPVIGDRAYGSDPERVGALGAARIRGLQSHRVAACAKHFPGLGAVPKDPHKLLPEIALDRETLTQVHLAPFRAAIAAGVASIMSSHVCYPAFDGPKAPPATFSPAIIRDLLRQQLGFSGVIMTDDLEMGALRGFGTIGETAVRAAEAGHDLFLICSDLAAGEEALSQLRRAYQFGRLSMADLQASAARINALRKKCLPEPLAVFT